MEQELGISAGRQGALADATSSGALELGVCLLLRYLVLDELTRAGSDGLTLAELDRRLRVRGVVPTGRPGKTLSDAMRTERSRKRVERVGHGRYRLGRVPRTTAWRVRRRLGELGLR